MLAWVVLGLTVAVSLAGIGWYVAARRTEPETRPKFEAMGTLTFMGAAVLLVLALYLLDD